MTELEELKTKMKMSFYTLEDKLHSNRKMQIKTKSAMIWAALTILFHSDLIDYEQQKRMYGEFMSHEMGVRI